MNRRRVLPVIASVLTLLLAAGCGEDTPEPAGDATSETQPSDDPAEPAGETDIESDSEGTPASTDASAADLSAPRDCQVEIEITGDINAELGIGSVRTNSGGGPRAFYQVLGENVLLAVYSGGESFDPNLILTAGTETYGMDVDAAGLDIAEDGSGATLDTELVVVPSQDKKAQVTGTITC